jgi:hypothetical protein
MTKIGNYDTVRAGTVRSLKSAVTRAKNRKDWDSIVQICDRAEAVFKEVGYPDDWSFFDRARMDANLQLRLGVPLARFLGG